MRRRTGNLMGRYVPDHLRKWPSRSGEYVSVSAYQEKIEAFPSRKASPPQQYELNLEINAE
jgi:hypothetical protein